MRVCLDCPAIITDGTRCPTCTRRTGQARGTNTQRGYGPAHTTLRAHYQRRMNAGETLACWRCGKTINPNAWHLGHDDTNRDTHRGPECPTCNLSAAGHASHKWTTRISPNA